MGDLMRDILKQRKLRIAPQLLQYQPLGGDNEPWPCHARSPLPFAFWRIHLLHRSRGYCCFSQLIGKQCQYVRNLAYFLCETRPAIACNKSLFGYSPQAAISMCNWAL